MDIIDADKAGCWVNGCEGRYIGEHVQDIAIEHGHNAFKAKVGGFTYEDAWIEAEKHMNTLAPTGYYFGSIEGGDWGLWSIDHD